MVTELEYGCEKCSWIIFWRARPPGIERRFRLCELLDLSRPSVEGKKVDIEETWILGVKLAKSAFITDCNISRENDYRTWIWL